VAFPGLRRAGAVALAALLAAACSGSSGPGRATRRSTTTSTTRPDPAADGHLALGTLLPVTGPVSAVTTPFGTGIQLAVDEINVAGGVNGRPVTLDRGDDASDPATGRAALGTLVTDHRVDAVIGPSSSQVAAELLPDLERDRVVMCSGSNTAGALSVLAPAAGGWYFRTAPPDRVQAVALARLLEADGRARPFVIAPDAGVDRTFVDETLTATRAAGLHPVEARAADLDSGPALARAMTRARADAVLLLGNPDSVAPALRALVDAGKGPQQVPTYGNDTLQTAELGPKVDPTRQYVVAGIRGTTPSGAPAGIDHPLGARLSAAGVEPFFSASAYDCTMLVALAAVAAKSDRAEEIRTHLPALLKGRRDCTGFAECAALLRAGRTIHYRGAFSAYDRWHGNEPGSGTYDVWTMGLDAHPTIGPPENQIHVG
jgi:branched-chain amino acid transport system substrate-binding protein